MTKDKKQYKDGSSSYDEDKTTLQLTHDIMANEKYQKKSST